MSSLLPYNIDEDTPLQANIRRRSSLVAPEPADWTAITPGDVQSYIDTVKRRKASGPDGIFPDVYRKMSEKISLYLAKLYGVSKDRYLPSTLEEGRVCDFAQRP